MGIKKTRPVESKTLKTYLKELDAPNTIILEVDSVRYRDLISLKLEDTAYKYNKWFVQNHIQPAQAIIFEKGRKTPISSYFSCNSEQRFFANLTWNKYNELEFFPSLTYSDSIWNDSLITLDEILKTVNLLNEGNFSYKDAQKNKHPT
jgi:hypothetical protein